MRLLPREALAKTGPVDHSDWNYRALIGYIARRRFALVRSLLRGRSIDRLLEIGYGSGIFAPELARYARELYGIDPHPYSDQVTQSLREFGISAQLRQASAEAIPFADGMFDAVVIVSAFEFIPDMARAAAEIRRVLAPAGRAVVVTPGTSPLLDLALRLTTGESAKDDYGDRRAAVAPALMREFRIAKKRAFPSIIGSVLPIYHAYDLLPRSHDANDLSPQGIRPRQREGGTGTGT